MKHVKIKKGAMVAHGHSYIQWQDPDKVFKVKETFGDILELVIRESGFYENGYLLANIEDVIDAEPPIKFFYRFGGELICSAPIEGLSQVDLDGNNFICESISISGAKMIAEMFGGELEEVK